jgi:hypothetical protein
MKLLAALRSLSGATAVFLLTAAGSGASASAPVDIVPARAGGRSQAVAVLATGSPASPCLTAQVQSLRSDRQRGTLAARRALASLAADASVPSERVDSDVNGISVRFTTDRGAFDRVDFDDDNANGRPDTVDEALSGVAAAQRLLVEQLELASPGPVDVVLSRLGSSVEGLSMPFPGKPLRTHIWLDPSARGGNAGVRRAAEHQFAHAVASAAGLDPAWGEAFANWASLTIEGAPDDRTLALMAAKFAAQGDGLATQDLELAGGNASWFAFLNDAYGPTAVKLAVEELGRGGSDQAALDRALRRASGDSIDAALREFQVWSLLVGSRDDRKHFSFGSRLPNPTFAALEDALPALSVQSNPEIGPMGQAAVLIQPDAWSGGLDVRFEGDPTSRWGSDLLIVQEGGELRRVPLPLDAVNAGELTVPLQDVREVILLVRNLDADGRPARRYSFAAHFDPGFPAEFGSIRAEAAAATGGSFVSWETFNERHLLGFNVLRARSDRGPTTRINPVWIPSMGESASPAGYSFFDATATPGVAYRYRIEAVTLEGLQSRSEAVPISPAP